MEYIFIIEVLTLGPSGISHIPPLIRHDLCK